MDCIHLFTCELTGLQSMALTRPFPVSCCLVSRSAGGNIQFQQGGGGGIQKIKYKNKCDLWAVCNLYCKKGVASCVKVLVHKGLHHMLVS